MKGQSILLVFITMLTLNAFGQQRGYDDIEKFQRKNNGWAKVYQNDKVGFITKDGDEVVKPIYDDIGKFGKYQRGWAAVWINDKMGFINDNGEVVVAPKYDNIDKFKKGKAIVFLKDKQGLINEYGEEIVDVGEVKFVE